MNSLPNQVPAGEGFEIRSGQVLGRYELLVPIAAGGMAQVWAARLKGARQFQKIVAVKTMLPRLSEDAQFEQMFLDEAALASRVRHPNAVEILELGEESGVLYLVMEFIEGVPLNQLMKAAKERGGVPYPIAAKIALQACAGLHAAHELKDDQGQLVGLVHRDVSPQNILVTYEGVTKVVDFGVAKATALGGGATQAGQVKGKISYMAPEQVNGEGLDRRADVFALGIVLYALTTGKHPFRRESEAATMFQICSPDPVIPPSKVRADYPPELEAVLLKALEKNRNHRFASCDQFLRALDGLPSHLRVSSDGDVADFVNSLVGDKRSEQRGRIDQAIARANAAPEGGFWAGHPDQQSQLTGQRPPPQTGSHELSGLPSSLSAVRRKRNLLLAVGLLALGAGGAVAVQGLSAKPPLPQARPGLEAAPQGSAFLQPSIAPTEAPKQPPAEASSASSAEALGSASPSSGSSSAGIKSEPPANKGKTQGTSVSKPATSGKAASGTDGKPKTGGSSSNWKYDAGF